MKQYVVEDKQKLNHIHHSYHTMYNFNPKDFGYDSVANFPELQERYGSTTFVKVIVLDKNRKSYHYSAVYNIGAPGDQRWEFNSAMYDPRRGDEGYTYSSRVEYSGLISSKEFAETLLSHMFGTTLNNSVATVGVERLNSRLNEELFDLRK